MQKISTEEFIQRARRIHGDLYDYSGTRYTNTRTKIEVVCAKHGPFSVTPNDHLSKKSGCPRCKGKSATTETFIVEAIKIHGDRYDYSDVDYKTSRIPVEIICKVHGSFFQAPAHHIHHRSGCTQCNRGKSRNTITFIEDARKIHGDRYDYSNVNFKNMNALVSIGCQIHGAFQIRPKSHIDQRHGCRKCGSIQNGLRLRKNLDEFVSQALKIHGTVYSYDFVDYINTDTHMKITCKTHGNFKQTPANHLHGQGCPKCNRFRDGLGGYSWEYFANYIDEREKAAVLYMAEFKINKEHFYKIGITKKNLKERFYYKKPKELSITPLIEHKTILFDAFTKEQHLLNILKNYRYFPNYKFGGYTECFKVKDEVLSTVNAYLEINNR
jgi:hypothetical protein